MTLAEILQQTKTLSAQERKELAKLLIEGLEVLEQPPDEQQPPSTPDHWGQNLLRLLDEVGPIELAHPEIDDPVEWVKHIRQEQAAQRTLDWGEEE